MIDLNTVFVAGIMTLLFIAYVGVVIGTYFYGKKIGKDQQKVNNTEAIFGFASWLSTREETLKVGAHEEAASIADAAARYSLASGFPAIRDTHYPKNLVTLDDTGNKTVENKFRVKGKEKL